LTYINLKLIEILTFYKSLYLVFFNIYIIFQTLEISLHGLLSFFYCTRCATFKMKPGPQGARKAGRVDG